MTLYFSFFLSILSLLLSMLYFMSYQTSYIALYRYNVPAMVLHHLIPCYLQLLFPCFTHDDIIDYGTYIVNIENCPFLFFYCYLERSHFVFVLFFSSVKINTIVI